MFIGRMTYTDRLGYPKGESVALLDLNPLMAVVLKPLSPLLPEPAQYFGIEVILVLHAAVLLRVSACCGC